MRKNRWLFTKLLADKSTSAIIAYLGVIAAFNAAVNFIEFRFSTDVQFSFTMAVAMLTGILVGPIFGFGSCFIGDLVGFLFNNKGMVYMPWVGISIAMFAFLAGVVFNVLPGKGKGAMWWKTALLILSSFLICTVGINSTGFFFYNKAMGFSDAVERYVAANFGKDVFFFAYVVYRLFVKLQIINSIVNYVLLTVSIPFLVKLKPLKLDI